MYNTKIVCTYHTPDVFLATDEVTLNEMEFVRDTIYRQELLDILGLEERDETLMSDALHKLYEQLKGSQELRACMLKLARRLMTADEEYGLLILFAYEFMHLTHICVSEYLETGKISENNLSTLQKRIF
jgi:hypothetical protein